MVSPFPTHLFLIFQKDKVECLVCMNDVPFEKTYSLNCSHRFYCLDCWRDYLDAEFKLKVPPSHSFLLSFIRFILPFLPSSYPTSLIHFLFIISLHIGCHFGHGYCLHLSQMQGLSSRLVDAPITFLTINVTRFVSILTPSRNWRAKKLRKSLDIFLIRSVVTLPFPLLLFFLLSPLTKIFCFVEFLG